MREEAIVEAIEEAKRFAAAAGRARKRLREDKYAYMGCAETAACRRASMDLTKSLAKLRKAN